jgi:hypothetical protein
MARDFKARVAIGDASGARSNIWMVSTANNDVYAFHRDRVGIEKISFHQSGICRSAFTEQHGTPEGMTNRVIQRWNRPQIPPAGSNTLIRLLSVGFPTSHLGTGPVPVDKPMLWLAPAPPGRYRNFELALTPDPPETVSALIEQWADHQVLATHPTPNGTSLILFSGEGEWTRGDLIMPASMHEADDFAFPAVETPEQARPIRLTIYTSPRDGDCLMCAELSGFRVPGGGAQRLFPSADHLSRDRVLDKKPRRTATVPFNALR